MFVYVNATNPTYVWCCSIILLLPVSLISNTAVSTLPAGTTRTHTRFFFETLASGHINTDTNTDNIHQTAN